MPPESFNDIARAIQLALTPVFLLTGIAGILNVMTGRLARIVDRIRELAENPRFSEYELLIPEREFLERRRDLTSAAITASTVAALIVCLVIAVLFFEVMFNSPAKWLLGALFTSAMVALVIGLTFFLREVHLARRPFP